MFDFVLRGRTGHKVFAVLEKYRFAHRGFHDKPAVPENSIPAFCRALERGWGAELDVHLLKDGSLYVFHDSKLQRCTGAEGVIEDLDCKSVRELRLEGTDEKIPSFDEVLNLFEGKAPLIIELKAYNRNHEALTKAVCERLDRYKGDFCIESFDPRVLEVLRKIRPDICRGQLAQDFQKNGDGVQPLLRRPLAHLWWNVWTRPDFIAYRFEDRDCRDLRRCVDKLGIKEVSWTIRSRETLLEAEKNGCIPIFETFDPDK
ncbi:MAG: glycerophosphodiester phosphodiesterase [Clostridiales bacterium]|nr:glycerophosphodiester phosphodiesterase [Clostridiales bacterium]